MSKGIYNATKEFEDAVAKYTGAPHAIAIDNASNALFLCLMYEGVKDKEVCIPSRTYMSVPCAIIQAGGIPSFYTVAKETIKGAYKLMGTNIYDSALRFTCDMYIPESHMCLSFTGAFKHLKLPKGGMILTDDPLADKWFRKARFSGRNEVDYHSDHFDTIGWNFYMLPEIAIRGLHLMRQFYDTNGKPISNPDVELPYPDLSKYEIYTNPDLFNLSPKELMKRI